MIFEIFRNLLSSFGFFLLGFIMSVAVFFIISLCLIFLRYMIKKRPLNDESKKDLLLEIFKLSAINGGAYAVIMFGLLSALSSSTSAELQLYLFILQIGAIFLPTAGTMIVFIVYVIRNIYSKN